MIKLVDASVDASKLADASLDAYIKFEYGTGCVSDASIFPFQ